MCMATSTRGWVSLPEVEKRLRVSGTDHNHAAGRAEVTHLMHDIPHAEVGESVVLHDVQKHRAVDAILHERTLVAL